MDLKIAADTLLINSLRTEINGCWVSRWVDTYFVQRVQVVLTVSRRPGLGVPRGGRAGAGAHHTVRGAR